MILYRHAPSKAALLDGVTETVLAQLQVDPADPDWAAQLRAVARSYRALALAHPNVVPLLVTRPLATPLALRPPGTLRPLEDILALLTRAGFSPPDALHIYRALFGFLHGHVLNELQELVDNPDETDDLLRLGLHRLPVREFPLLRSLAPVLAAYDGAAELERGLDILLTGLTTTLTLPDRPPARSLGPLPGRPSSSAHPAQPAGQSPLRRRWRAAPRSYQPPAGQVPPTSPSCRRRGGASSQAGTGSLSRTPHPGPAPAQALAAPGLAPGTLRPGRRTTARPTDPNAPGNRMPMASGRRSTPASCLLGRGRLPSRRSGRCSQAALRPAALRRLPRPAVPAAQRSAGETEPGEGFAASAGQVSCSSEHAGPLRMADVQPLPGPPPGDAG